MPTRPPSTHPLEFQVDATTVNTDTGGRDRPLGDPSSPDPWHQRTLPTPTARRAFAAVEEIDTFAPRGGAWAERLGRRSFERLSVLGDGAEWIGNAADDQFPGDRGVLDFFHAAEHLGTAADGLFGDADAERRGWYDAARGALLRDGWYGLQEHLGRTLSDADRAAVYALVGYLANHSHRLNYRHRPAKGEPIGSGLIEGACEQVIGQRRKQTGHGGPSRTPTAWPSCVASPTPTRGPTTGTPPDTARELWRTRSHTPR